MSGLKIADDFAVSIAEQTGLTTLTSSAEVEGALLVCLDAHFPHFSAAHQTVYMNIRELTGFDPQSSG